MDFQPVNRYRVGRRTVAIYAFLAFLIPARTCHGDNGNGKRIDSKEKTAVIETIDDLLVEKYIFLDVAEKTRDHLNEKLRNGEYDDIDAPMKFASVLTDQLRVISGDHHFFIEFNPDRAQLVRAQKSQSQEEVREANEILAEKDRLTNFGFKRIEHLKGNIGYLDLDFFANAMYGGETAVAAMNFLANSDAVIIDLRDTPGGWPNMVQLLCSYFVEGKDSECRTLLNTFERRFDGSIEQYWTISYVPGKRMYDMDLYVLTSRYTGSGAEEFAYNMKNLERAAIVGETTGGAAHNVEEVVIQDVFVMHLPTGRPVNPISGTNWERTGVEPDVEVPAEDALDTAYRMAIERVLERSENEDQKFKLHWALDGLEAKLEPVDVATEILERYVGIYGERTVTLENGELHYQRTGPKYRLIPLKENLFKVEGLDYFRVEFVPDEKGNATELIGLYDNGMKDPSERTK